MDNHLERPEIQSALKAGYGRVRAAQCHDPRTVRLLRGADRAGWKATGVRPRFAAGPHRQSRIDRVKRLVWLCVFLISLVAIVGYVLSGGPHDSAADHADPSGRTDRGRQLP